MVVNPPQEQQTVQSGYNPQPNQPQYNSAPPPSWAGAPQENRLFIYPRQGQSAKQQEDDKNKCNDWAVSQVGGKFAADHNRAMAACLDAKGYTVK